MALTHAACGDVITVQHGAENLSRFSSIAMAKTKELELIRLVLPKGKTTPEHHVPGELTLLCLQGEIVVDIHGTARPLHAGEMLYLFGGQAHALRAEQDALVLLTILLA
jgi:quercetin dioxygenase-like cupin family protein